MLTARTCVAGPDAVTNASGAWMTAVLLSGSAAADGALVLLPLTGAGVCAGGSTMHGPQYVLVQPAISALSHAVLPSDGSHGLALRPVSREKRHIGGGAGDEGPMFGADCTL